MHDPRDDAWLEAVLKQEITTLGCPGLVAGYLDTNLHPNVVAAGLRRIGSVELLRQTDAIHIGSCTKAFTGLLIGNAIAAGQLSFSATLGSLDDKWKQSPWASTTIDALLRHEAGLPENVKWWDLSRTGGELTEQRRDVMNPRFQNSTNNPTLGKFSYSNVGYVVLGSVIDKVYGMPFEDVIQQRIARPGMLQSIGFGVPSSVSGHSKNPAGFVATSQDNPPVMNSAGRLHLSVTDWLRTAMLHMDSSDFLPQRIRKQLYVTRNESGYAGGWITVNRAWANGITLTHAGSNTFWFALMWVAPRTGRAFAAVANAAGEGVSKGLDRVISSMILRTQVQSR